jgi:hypothetical protein
MNKNSGHTMPEKTPLDYPTVQYFLVALLGAIGGLVSVLQEFFEQIGKCWKCAIARAIVSMVTSGFCGVLAFWLCESLSVKPLMTAFVIGISGHMGGRALKVVEKIVVEKFNLMN